MRPLRILIVTDHYPPFIGGAHRQSYILSHQLKERGHDVRVATIWHGGQPELENDGVAVYRFKDWETRGIWASQNTRQRHHPPFPDPFMTLSLRRLIREFRPDVVHSHGWITYSAAAALLFTKIPLLISARDYSYECATRTLLYQGRTCSGPGLTKCIRCSSDWYGSRLKGAVAALGVLGSRPLLTHRVDAIHSISTFVQKITRRALLSNHTRASIPEVIIPSFLSEEDDAAGWSADHINRLPKEPFILFVGALSGRKGVPQLLEAYQMLRNRQSGDGPIYLPEAYRKLGVKAHGKSRSRLQGIYRSLEAPPPLVLIGTQDRDTPKELPEGAIILENFPHGSVMAAWERCLFGVVPSLWPEPLGAVVFEAMSKGKAVIGTTPGGHADMIVDGETGFLVPPGDADQLAEAMRRLIDEPALRESFGKAGKERVRLFTAETILPQFEALYYRVIGDQQSVGPRVPFSVMEGSE